MKLLYLCYLRFVLSNVHMLFLHFVYNICLDVKSDAVVAQWQGKVT